MKLRSREIINVMEITSYVVTSQHNSLSQHPVSLYSSKRTNPTEVKVMEMHVDWRSAHLYATIWTKKAMRLRNTDRILGHTGYGHTSLEVGPGWDRVENKGKPLGEAARNSWKQKSDDSEGCWGHSFDLEPWVNLGARLWFLGDWNSEENSSSFHLVDVIKVNLI